MSAVLVCRNVTAALAFQRAQQELRGRNLNEAIARYQQAEELGHPADECAGGRWMAYMLQGRFERAWQESDAIRGRGAADPNRFWQGEPIDGKRLMVRSLHGFGDAVQMLRYAPMLACRAKQVIFEVSPALVSVAPFFDGIDHVIPWASPLSEDAGAWDVQVEVMELPYLFRTHMVDLPIATGYLQLPSELIREHALPSLRDVPKVGLAWQSSAWDPSRSLPSETVRTLLVTEGCEFWNLQMEAAFEDCGLRGTNASRTGISSLAAVISQLDLVITVDTLVAHLAGAMGVRAWVLLQHAADWRWMVNRDDSPWYPSLRLLRQPSSGDWQGLMEDVQRELAAWLAHARSGNHV